MRISNLRLNLSLENAFVIHSKDFLGYDPESTSYGNNIHSQNIINFNYPMPRTLTFGVNVQF
jgi:TonB-dependent starch-binding outer membrane protein SusC